MVKKSEIASTASESPSALSPLVGINQQDLMAAAGSILSGAIRHPFTVMKHGGALGRGMADVLLGLDDKKPNPKDRRFADPAWTGSPLHRRLFQAWETLADQADALVDDFGFEGSEKTRTQIVTRIFTDALAPSNTLLNPAALKQAIDTGGASLLNGASNLVSDVRTNGMLPRMVDTEPFKVGENVASTPGSVVYRTDMLELIQYTPQTPKVYARPLLFIPPQINKFYVLDLSPEKSLVKYLVSQGHQIFVASWRNPQPEHRDWGLGDYVTELDQAVDAILKITKSDSLNVSGGCSGGITQAAFLSHLATKNDKRVNSATFWVCVLDPQPDDSDLGSLISPSSIEIARNRSKSKGVLTGRDLSTIFAWLRPNDLIWNYVVNNYLMGRKPPAFDVLFWNQDSTNLSAQLHSDYLDLYIKRPFVNPGSMDLLDEPLDISQVDMDAFIVAGTTDHITPWKACYRTTTMLPGNIEFVLSNSGHIQSILNPPENPKAKYFTNPDLSGDADEWLEGAEAVNESWWVRWLGWLNERSGEQVPAPRKAGDRKYRVIEAAPGSYVFD